MKILITGSDGAIGREIASHLKKLKFNLILHTKKKIKKIQNIIFFAMTYQKRLN